MKNETTGNRVMNVIPTSIEDVLVLEPRVFGDRRGHFMETYRQDRYRDVGIEQTFVQDNLSFSLRGTLRGLHFQVKKPQAKLVQVIAGEIFDVAVDIRPESATFGQWTGVILSDQNHRQLFIPEGFAHGFIVLSEAAHFLYKCSAYYDPADEGGLIWSDADVGIDWPRQPLHLSEKDARYPRLKEIPKNGLYSPEGC